MEGSQSNSILVAGYPGTGKTTYLAALWYVLNHTDEINTQYKLHRLYGDDTYLNAIVDDWISYREVERTKMSQEADISMEIEDTETGSAFRLAFPDLSGERFRQQFEERHCTDDYASLVRASQGCLLFIHCGQITSPTSIVDAQPTIAALTEANDNGDASSVDVNSSEELELWEKKLSPTQVKYVDLLQFILHISSPSVPIRLAIVLSAWDLVQALQRSPASFISDRLPLLQQFLQANDDKLQFQVFGVSAQGIDLNDEKKINQFADDKLKPADRIIVCAGTSLDVSNDITMPIKWTI